MSLFIQNNNGTIYSECSVTINNGQVTVEPQTHDTPQPPFKGGEGGEKEDRCADRVQTETKSAEDIEAVDTSFFGIDRYTEEVCERNLKEAINQAKSKADACRRIMSLDTCGYIHISNVKDERKAELINQFSMPKYIFYGDDFRKARNN